MLRNAHNSLILPIPQIAQVIVGSLFFFVFLCSPLGGTPFATLRDAIESHWLSSCASLCRNVAAGRDGM